MNGSPNSRQRATPVASSRLSPRGRLRSSHLSIRLNGRTPSSSEPSRRAGRWSCQTSSRCLKRGMLLSSIIAGTQINHGKGGFGNHSSFLVPYKSAESYSLMVRIGFEQRVALLAADAARYYITDHYVAYPSVLVRLSEIDRQALQALLRASWEFVTSRTKTRKRNAGY